MIQIEKDSSTGNLILSYSSENKIEWLKLRFDNGETWNMKKVFSVSKSNVIAMDEYSATFLFADIVDINGEAFYRVNKNILGISFDLYISTKYNVNETWFIGKRNISIFRTINSFWKEDKLFIGLEGKNAITEKDFKKTIKSLPNDTEIRKYVNARIYSTMKNALPIKKDAETAFQKYLERKILSPKDLNDKDFIDFEIERYDHLIKRLDEMLKEEEGAYKESDWQKIIMSFIQVLFPKYVFIEQHPRINLSERHRKIPDIIMADVNGYVDIIEIKKPFATGMISEKSLYRNNYIPKTELSGAIMQCEKYIYYMTSDTKKAENDLNKQFASVLPKDYKLQIVNPKAMVIMGRSNSFAQQQKEDFEIIRRKYKNILDIITYDDLLFRIKQTAKLLREKAKRQ